MRHHQNKTFSDKKELLIKIDQNKDLSNSLFYANRNLKIIEIINIVEDYFKNKGFKVTAEWSESSFGVSAFFNIIFHDKKHQFEYPITIKRDEMLRNNHISNLIYTAKKGTGCHVPFAISQEHKNFIAEVNSENFFELLSGEVNKCNYPFDKVLSLEDKVTFSKELGNNNKGLKELFSTAKSMSKEFSFYNIKKFFLDFGFDVSVSYINEQLFKVTLNKLNYSFDVNMKKETIENVPLDICNEMFLFDNVVLDVTKSKSKKITDFVNLVNGKDFKDLICSEINGMNYPFGYKSLSSY